MSVLQGEADLVCEAQAHGQRGGLGGLPRESARRGGVVEWGKCRRGDVDAGAGGRGVEEDAGKRANVVGSPGALVGGEVGGRVGVSGGDDGESLGRDDWAEALGEAEGDTLFGCVIWQVSAGVGAAVRGVEQDEVAVEGGERSRRSGRRGLRSSLCRRCCCWWGGSRGSLRS